MVFSSSPALEDADTGDSAAGPERGKRRGRRVPAGQPLAHSEIGAFCNAMNTARRQLSLAAKVITERYDLGPRGAWIIGLIATGSAFPSDLTRVFGVGRSLITAELVRLEKAGLITCTKNSADGRRVELEVTPLGQSAHHELGEELAKLVSERLVGYTRDDLLFCTRLLEDFSGGPRQGFDRG
jgi:DNA-binding MarR family transcriptional regulator